MPDVYLDSGDVKSDGHGSRGPGGPLGPVRTGPEGVLSKGNM